MNDILAYHIVWTTYGTWLPGDVRGWVKKGEWVVQAPDLVREKQMRELMVEEPVFLTDVQRAIVEGTSIDHCRIRGWTLHAVNARRNHVHAVVSAAREPSDVRDQFKAWCSRRLSDAAGLKEPVAKKAGRKHWFTEGGDTETIETEEYLQNAIAYVQEQ